MAWFIARLGGWEGYACERRLDLLPCNEGAQAFATIQQGWLLALGRLANRFPYAHGAGVEGVFIACVFLSQGRPDGYERLANTETGPQRWSVPHSAAGVAGTQGMRRHEGRLRKRRIWQAPPVALCERAGVFDELRCRYMIS